MLIGEYDYEMDMREKQLLCSLVQKGRLSVREAAEEMGVSEDAFLKWME